MTTKKTTTRKTAAKTTRKYPSCRVMHGDFIATTSKGSITLPMDLPFRVARKASKLDEQGAGDMATFFEIVELVCSEKDLETLDQVGMVEATILMEKYFEAAGRYTQRETAAASMGESSAS